MCLCGAHSFAHCICHLLSLFAVLSLFSFNHCCWHSFVLQARVSTEWFCSFLLLSLVHIFMGDFFPRGKGICESSLAGAFIFLLLFGEGYKGVN